MVGSSGILSVLLMVLLMGVPANPADLTVPIAYAAPLSTDDLKSIAQNQAILNGVNPKKMEAVIGCESGWDVNAVGDHGSSFGLAQIHLPAHPEISRDDAEDPYFAISWMAKQWSLGNQGAWSCYRDLFE